MSGVQLAIYWGVTACLAYLAIVYLWQAVLAGASWVEHLDLVDRAHTDDDAIAASPFTIPVSILAPVYNVEDIVEATVQSLLDMDYAATEVIVANDGSTDATFAKLAAAFDLEPRVMFYRSVLKTQPVRGVYVSRIHRNLIVVDKENGGKADALNCALNVARYRYVCTIDGDTFYQRDALRKGMQPAAQDPATVVGVTCPVALHRYPEETESAAGRTEPIDPHVFTNFQMLDFLRSFMTTRLGATRWRFMLCASGAFSLWRRDVLLQMNGFATGYTCEDIEITFRAHETLRRARTPYRIVSLGTLAGTTETPPYAQDLVRQRARWQRVVLEAAWSYRRMTFNPRYGSVGTVGVPHFMLTEVLAPFMQIAGVILTVAAWTQGLLDIFFAQLMLIIAFTQGFLTNAAILFHDAQSRRYRLRDLLRLVALGPLDPFLYRPIIFVAQTKGLIDFLRGRKDWDAYKRHRPRS